MYHTRDAYQRFYGNNERIIFNSERHGLFPTRISATPSLNVYITFTVSQVVIITYFLF